MGRRGIIALVGVMVALATGTAAWAASGPPNGPDPAVKEWPAWPYLTYCGELPFYAVTAFSGPTGAELGTRPSEVALRESLEKEEIPYVRSKSDWRLIAEDEDRAEFTHGRLSGRLEWLAFEVHEGRWKLWQYSSHCEPTSIVGTGPVVTWSLADPQPAPNVAVRRIRVDLGPGPCSSGRSKNKRARFTFRKWGRKLLMTVWLKPLPPGIYNCKGRIEPPKSVTLPRKMKLHKLWDGATYPPRPAIKQTR